MEAAAQASTISATSEEVVNKKKKDFKSKQDEASKSNNSHKHLEFVNLSKDVKVRKSMVREHDFLSSMKVGSSSGERRDEKNTKEQTSESRRTFSCIFCKRQFSTSHALGGLQNTHKPERALKKYLRQRIDDGALGYPSFPYNTYPSAISTPPHYTPLGVRMESMIQKPSYPTSPYSFGYGHSAMLWQEMLNTSNVRLRNIEGTSGASSTIEAGGGSGINNNVRSILKFGDSSTNRGTSSSTIMDKKNPAPSKDEIHHSNIEEISSDSKSSGLDFSLKL